MLYNIPRWFAENLPWKIKWGDVYFLLGVRLFSWMASICACYVSLSFAYLAAGFLCQREDLGQCGYKQAATIY